MFYSLDMENQTDLDFQDEQVTQPISLLPLTEADETCRAWMQHARSLAEKRKALLGTLRGGVS